MQLFKDRIQTTDLKRVLASADGKLGGQFVASFVSSFETTFEVAFLLMSQANTQR